MIEQANVWRYEIRLLCWKITLVRFQYDRWRSGYVRKAMLIWTWCPRWFNKIVVKLWYIPWTVYISTLTVSSSLCRLLCALRVQVWVTVELWRSIDSSCSRVRNQYHQFSLLPCNTRPSRISTANISSIMDVVSSQDMMVLLLLTTLVSGTDVPGNPIAVLEMRTAGLQFGCNCSRNCFPLRNFKSLPFSFPDPTPDPHPGPCLNSSCPKCNPRTASMHVCGEPISRLLSSTTNYVSVPDQVCTSSIVGVGHDRGICNLAPHAKPPHVCKETPWSYCGRKIPVQFPLRIIRYLLCSSPGL